MQTTINSNIFTTYIFGADTISDFMGRVMNIKEITNYDNELIAQINENIKEVQKQETTLKNLKASLEEDKKEQASLQKTFQAKLTEQNKTVADNTSEAAANQESIESIQKNLAAIQKASDASKVNNVTQATPNKKPAAKPSQPQKPSTDNNQSSNTNQENNSSNQENNNTSQEENNNTSSDNTLTSSEELGLAIANKALTRQGYMYVWGGGHSWSSIKNPNWTQFDCSGLVNWAHYQAGVDLGRIHYTGSLINAGKGVTKSQLQAGDIILFSDNGKASGVHHVGIYIGDNKMVHAPSTGKAIQVANLNYSYWQREWYTCRRLY
ncbi:NlpC/P60 family protein [Allocoprobacillus halotolerans]|uniref:NlpC/P60 family protein n=1 Tax=Allocoprobacillus halotolerans TaxID=2944914 RepID=A0ABY5HY59_9FIRM|nr:NlpC/P60 family protein [Allocoprobacillus halotolerans]UTY38007.1 NlpC/P60 family protein [Allocoprobacillus halotolerans]